MKPGLHWYSPELVLSVELFGIHGPPSGPEHHASHKQSVIFVLASEELEFNGHPVQFTVPFESLYMPVRQATHGPPFGPVYPMLHRQFVIDPLHAGAAEFAGHTVQFALASDAYCPAAHTAHVLLSAAKVGEYVPTEQGVQFAAPFVALYVPARQALH